MMAMDTTQWACAILGALLVGVSKTAIGGLSALAVALFTYSFASGKQASGLVLPLLIFADFIAVFTYQRHARWHHLWKLFPWTAVGVVLGYFALGRISDRDARLLIGTIILSLAALSFWRRLRPRAIAAEGPMHWGVAVFVGILAGFITLVANAAGPLMAIYLVAMRLPKLEYVGTAAVFFLLLNLFKVPFMVSLGLITVETFGFNLLLLPAVVLGTMLGRWLLARINQRAFEQIVLGLSAMAGILLLL
jgi:uncharacterized membrane protein YfcA